jgi:hypothetical protein
MEEIDLNFKNDNIFNNVLNKYSEVAIPLKKKVRSERAELIEFFVSSLRNKDGNKFPIRTIIFKLSHIPTKDLYYVKSVFEDNLQRGGLEKASKEFWWSLKAQ